MKLEVGKYYRTRDGRKAGPMMACEIFGGEFWSNTGGAYNADGSHVSNLQGDIIAEWTNTPEVGPVRTVTTTQIIPGQYGCVKVHDPGSKYVRINVDSAMDVEALTDAIATITSIRDAMQADTIEK